MTIADTLDEVIEDFKIRFNKVLAKAGLAPIEKFQAQAPNPELDEYCLGIYLSSPEGYVFEFNPETRRSVVTITFDGILSRDVEDSALVDSYLSALIVFVLSRNYGFSSTPDKALTLREDLNENRNSFMLSMKVVLDYQSDF